ncbi:MAG: hypothetical protein JRH20_17625 [Deltaproteobacteria bacterium]|nr:hypothetical protein [Deltaproteobacteria bacterium]
MFVPPRISTLRTSLGASMLLVGTLCVPTLASAYVPSTSNDSLKPLRWTHSNCVIMRPNSKGSADINDGSDVQAVFRSADRWRSASESCSYIRFVMEEASPDAEAEFRQGEANENVITWVEDGWRDVLGHDPQAAGLTTVFFVDSPGSSRDGKILDADIELNGEYFRFSAGEVGVKGRMDVENTVVHEMGHVLGLDHPCDDGLRSPTPKDHLGETIPKCSSSLPQELLDRTMYNFADQGEVKKRTLEADDILGICSTYPKADDPGVCGPVAVVDDGCSVGPGPFASRPFVGTLLALFALILLARCRRRA